MTYQVYAERRQRLMEQLPEGCVAVIPAAQEKIRSRDSEYPFRQDSDFFYLSGFTEPDAMLILAPGNELPVTLVCREKDELAETWTGYRLGPEQAVSRLRIDHAVPLDMLEDTLLEALNGQQILCFSQGQQPWADGLIFTILGQLRSQPKKGFKAPTEIRDLRPLLHEMRLFKDDHEIELMRRAGRITARAHKDAMLAARTASFEYQLEAVLHHTFTWNGARFQAYNTIVGAGANGCILHYTDNNSPLHDGDLVLIDAGCELHGYASDITRTFPISGRFTDEQRVLYEIVLEAELAAIQEIRPGGTLAQANAVAVRVMTEGLVRLGILVGDVDQLIADNAIRTFFMHGIGHWLGLDVHDVGDYKLNGMDRPLEPGMITTIEPGLYIPRHADVDPRWKDIGIRIEDNCLVTEIGCDVLTEDVPKLAEEIEALMAHGE